jgi:hypothetical protein
MLLSRHLLGRDPQLPGKAFSELLIHSRYALLNRTAKLSGMISRSFPVVKSIVRLKEQGEDTATGCGTIYVVGGEGGFMGAMA